MRILAAVVIALALLPPVSRAETPQAVVPSPAPKWSLGAGIGFWSTTPSFQAIASLPSSGMLAAPDAPLLSTSVERAIGPRTWLVLGAAGTYDRTRSDIPQPLYGPDAQTSGTLDVSLGARRFVTPPDALVDVSFVGLGSVGRGTGSWEYDDPARTDADWSGWRAGASGGIAVDRRLTSALSLRVETPLLQASWTKVWTDPAGGPEQSVSRFSVRGLIAPHLELRIAF